ncbi:MAG: tetratricopeptide repeat protein [Bacteroidales bacterium]|nr:tetratricopeptide repeat protein [Bacteroidales bacterium]
MMIKKYLILFIAIILFVNSYSANQQKVDSLINIVNTTNNDTIKIAAILAWDEEIYMLSSDSSIVLNSMVVEIAELALNSNKALDSNMVLKLKNELGSALNNLGSAYNKIGNTKKALECHFKSLEIKKEIGNKRGIAYSFNNIGYIYSNQANIPKALEYFHKSLKIRTEIDDKNGMAGSMINLGIIYYHQDNIDQALEYFFTSSELLKEIGDNRRIAYAYVNIGHIYTKQKKTEQALDYFDKSLEIYKKMGFKRGMADVYNNLGSVYVSQNNYTKAMEYFFQSQNIYEEIGRKKGISGTSNNIANCYLTKKDYSKAISYGNKSLSIAQEADLALEIREAAKTLFKIYQAIGKDGQALEMYQLYISVRDSVLSEENQKEAIRQKFKYIYEKQAAADSIQAAEAKKVTDARLMAQEAQISKEKTQRFALYGGVGLLLLFGGFMYNRYRVTNKQKMIIETQKTEVEEKNKEILDSIKYAKRIQSAILPAPQVVKEYLKDSFILYKPKDIVAGDFYWMEQKEDWVLFAAADCTGHGVPGAMVSVVCNNGLNRSVREYGLTDPGEILDKTREIVVHEFEKSDEDVQDGMDIALCSIQKNKLQYAGAHNPLWMIRNGEILETKPNKQPIGKFDNPKPYTTHNINLLKGDSIYIFSDGYADQFGGEKGKKLKAKAFKKLLLSIQHLNMKEQKEFIDEAFNSWKGDLDQLDDVCVIGVKI